MTKRMTTAELHVVMYQSIGGKETQRAPITDRELWCCHNPYVDGWDTTRWIYRVKPEPREWWLGSNGFAYESEKQALSRSQGFQTIHVREVLEGE